MLLFSVNQWINSINVVDDDDSFLLAVVVCVYDHEINCDNEKNDTRNIDIGEKPNFSFEFTATFEIRQFMIFDSKTFILHPIIRYEAEQ